MCSLVDSRRIAPVLGRWILTIEAQGVIVGLLDDVWSCCQTQPSFSSPSRVALPSPVCSTTPRFAWDAASTLKSSRSVAGLRCPASKKELSLVFPYRGGVYVNCFLSGAPPPTTPFALCSEQAECSVADFTELVAGSLTLVDDSYPVWLAVDFVEVTDARL